MTQNAFDKIVSEHKNRIYSYCMWILKNREDSEDVTQEVFIRFWQNQDTIHKQKHLSWLLTVAHHCCIDLIRQKKATVIQQRLTAADKVDQLAASNHPETNPELWVECSDDQKKLIEALSGLPEKTRSILLLHYFQDLKYETIAEMLDTKLVTVKVAVHRGKRMLKDALSESYPERMAL